MTLRYVLLVFISLGVFTVFAFARENAVLPTEKSYTDIESAKKIVEENYYQKHNTQGKSAAVTGDDFDDFDATGTHAQTREQARTPSDPKVAAAQQTLTNELKSLKILQKETDSSRTIYPEQNTMKEAVIEEQDEEGTEVHPDFSPQSWSQAKNHATLLFTAP